MSEIEHNVALWDGSVANTVGPSAVIAEMYPEGLHDLTTLYVGTTATVAGIELTPANSALRFQELDESRTAISGNTVTRLCPIAESCGSCALAGQGLSVAEMSRRNCARANTASTFELAGIPPEGRFMLLPVAAKGPDGKPFNDYYVVDDSRFSPELNGDEIMQNKLKPAYAVVFTGSWLREKGLDTIATGMQGADGSKGVAIAEFADELDDETLIIPFCSLRQNMGDRSEKDQILRGALTAYFDSKGYDDATRQRLLASTDISIRFAASATLKNFAHKIQVPREDADAPERERQQANRLREQYPDLVARAGGKITSAIVLNDQYPGAMERGNIFPQFEAEVGIRETPITPDNCPGDGQTCHIAYREETVYALEKQLVDMGIPSGRVRIDDQDVLDPANPANNAASNRREQNNGVHVNKTTRTLNAMVIRVAGKETA